MEFTVNHNNNTEYSIEFNEEVAIIRVRDLNQGVYRTRLALPTDAWYLLEAQRQEFRRFHMSRVIITNNQEGTQNMENKSRKRAATNPTVNLFQLSTRLDQLTTNSTGKPGWITLLTRMAQLNQYSKAVFLDELLKMF